MPKIKRKYTRREYNDIGESIGAVDRSNEPWNQPHVLMREAAEEIKRKNHRLEIVDAKLEMVYLMASLVRREPTSGQLCGASSEGIVSRLERAIAPTPMKEYTKVAPTTHRRSKSL